MRELLQGGAAPDQRDGQGCTALHWAADKGQLGAMEALLAAKADVNAVDGDGLTPLHYAALAEQRGAAEVLLNAGGADAEKQGADGSRAEELAPKEWEPLFQRFNGP